VGSAVPDAALLAERVPAACGPRCGSSVDLLTNSGVAAIFGNPNPGAKAKEMLESIAALGYHSV